MALAHLDSLQDFVTCAHTELQCCMLFRNLISSGGIRPKQALQAGGVLPAMGPLLSMTGACRFISAGRQRRWTQEYAGANGRITHLILGNEVSVCAQVHTTGCTDILL